MATKEVEQPKTAPKTSRRYFLPDHGVSVDATSLDEAVSKAKKASK